MGCNQRGHLLNGRRRRTPHGTDSCCQLRRRRRRCLDIFTKSGTKYTRKEIAGVSAPREIAVGPTGSLFVTWCDPCGSKDQDRLGIIEKPYAKLNETIKLATDEGALGLAVAATKAVFICAQRDGGVSTVYVFAYPYKTGKELAQTRGCYAAFGASPAGDLVFARPEASSSYDYNLELLAPPYTGKMKRLRWFNGLPESIIFAP